MDGFACPSADQLNGLIAETLNAGERDRVAAHLENCTACQHKLDALLAVTVSTLTRAATEPSLDPEFLDSLRNLVSHAVVSSGGNSSNSGRRLRGAWVRAEAATDCPASIGDFEIIGEIAKGGMAVVYKARQPRLGRIVAVKRLRFRDQDSSDVERFLREAEAVARLHHPNIVQVFEVGEDDGRPFLALEYIRGPTLSDYLNGSPVDPRAAAECLRKVALAVHHAHQQGIIHRDLKPANILLEPAGDVEKPPLPGEPDMNRPAPLGAFEPKVADFGLARRIGDVKNLTLPDMLAGTPAYLSPEQINRNADTISPASDVYALGAILYEMLTGRPPLVGPTVLATLRLVETAEPVAPRTLQPQLPRDLESVCLKCLAKEPHRRYASSADLAVDLERFLAGKPTVARPLSVIARIIKLVVRHPLTAAALVLSVAAVGCGLAAVLWQWAAAVTARRHLQVALLSEADQRQDAEENLYYGRLAQASILWESGEASQARGLLAACRPMAGRTDLRGWEWHYLNRQFRPETHIVPLDHWVNDLVAFPDAADSPTDVAVAVGRARMNLADRIVPGDGRAGFLRSGDPAPTLWPGPDLPGAALSVAVHPRGTFVAWGTNTGDIVLARGAAREVTRVIHTPSAVLHVCFDPTGGTLYATGEDVHLRAFDSMTGDLVHDQIARVGRPMILAVSPTSGLVACGGWTGVVRLFDPRDWRIVGDLAGHAGGVASLGFSVDGSTLAVGCGDGKVIFWDPTARRETRRIQSNGGPVNALALRSDGRALAIGGPDRTVRLYDLGSERLRATYRGHESSVRSLAFVAGGNRLVSGGQDGTVRIWDATRDVRGRLIPFDGRLNEAAFLSTPAGLLAVAASGTGRVQAWNLTDGRSVSQRNVPLTMRSAYPRRYMAFMAGGRRVVGIDKDDVSRLCVWDSFTGDRLATLPTGRSPVQVLGADGSGRRLAWVTSAGDGVVDVHWWDSDADRQPPPVQLPVRGLMAVAIDRAGGRIAAVAAANRPGGENAVWVFDVATAAPPAAVARGTGMFGGLAFSPDGRLLAVADNDAVHIYRTGTWELAFRIPIPPATTCLAFSPEGRRLVAVGYDGDATLLDPTAGKRVIQLRSLAGPRPDEMASDARVAFSPDGAWLLSTNWDGSINVWDGSPTGD